MTEGPIRGRLGEAVGEKEAEHYDERKASLMCVHLSPVGEMPMYKTKLY